MPPKGSKKKVNSDDISIQQEITMVRPRNSDGREHDRDRSNDTRINKKGWPKEDNDLIKHYFADFIDGKTKYPAADIIEEFLKSHPNFMANFNLNSEQERKDKLRGQLNNLKKTAKIHRKKLVKTDSA